MGNRSAVLVCVLALSLGCSTSTDDTGGSSNTLLTTGGYPLVCDPVGSIETLASLPLCVVQQYGPCEITSGDSTVTFNYNAQGLVIAEAEKDTENRSTFKRESGKLVHFNREGGSPACEEFVYRGEQLASMMRTITDPSATEYGYEDGRLTQITRTITSPSNTSLEWIGDKLQRIMRTVTAPGLVEYTWDGNRVIEMESMTFGSGVDGTTTFNYTDGLLTGWDGASAATLEYNDDGSLKSISQGATGTEVYMFTYCD